MLVVDDVLYELKELECQYFDGNFLENLDAGKAYVVTVIAINKKGASPAVYQTVETLQQPELQLIEEKIPVQTELGESELVYGVGAGVGVALTLLILLGVAVRHSSCGRAARGEWSGELLTGQSGLFVQDKVCCRESTELAPGRAEEEEGGRSSAAPRTVSVCRHYRGRVYLRRQATVIAPRTSYHTTTTVIGFFGFLLFTNIYPVVFSSVCSYFYF